MPDVAAGIGGASHEIVLNDNNQHAQLNCDLMETGPDRGQTHFTDNFGGGLMTSSPRVSPSALTCETRSDIPKVYSAISLMSLEAP